MAREDFEARLQRIEAVAPEGAAARARGGYGWGRFLLGALASATVVLAFANIQAISDLAPESIRTSATPGAFGAPVAVLSVLWFAAVPLLFVGGVLWNAIARKGRLLPRPFVTGAFAGLALAFAALQPTLQP